MEVIIVAMAVVALANFFFGGRLTGSNSSPTTITVGDVKSSDNCAELCAQWDAMRSTRCLAEAAAAAAQRKVDNLRAQLAVAIVAATALGVAAYIASFIPIYGWIVAAVLGTAAAIVFLAADFIAGQLTVADSDLGAAEATAADARAKEAAARALLTSKCPAEAGACLARPSPC